MEPPRTFDDRLNRVRAAETDARAKGVMPPQWALNEALALVDELIVTKMETALPDAPMAG